MSNDTTGHTGNGGSGLTAPTKPDHKVYSIRIDRQPFRVQEQTMTGSELRALPTPAIGAELDLFLVVPGGLDKLVRDGDVVDMQEGQHFISVPRDVTPGA